MKKHFKFNEITPLHRCVECGEPLKKNLILKNPNAKRCWSCTMLNRMKRQNPVNLALRAKLQAKQSRSKTKNSIYLTH